MCVGVDGGVGWGVGVGVKERRPGVVGWWWYIIGVAK